jgi:hypothetical protein
MSLKKGGAISTYVDYSKDWVNAEDSGSRNLAVDSSVGYNEYVFGRTTPGNDFVVATGLLEDKTGLLMTGAGKVKSVKKSIQTKVKKVMEKQKKKSSSMMKSTKPKVTKSTKPKVAKSTKPKVTKSKVTKSTQPSKKSENKKTIKNKVSTFFSKIF